MGATACVKEGIDLSQINHKPIGMGGLDTGLLRKSRFVPTSSNVTKLFLSSIDMDATVWVGKKNQIYWILLSPLILQLCFCSCLSHWYFLGSSWGISFFEWSSSFCAKRERRDNHAPKLRKCDITQNADPAFWRPGGKMKYSQPSQHLHCKEIRSRNLGWQPLAALFNFGLGR